MARIKIRQLAPSEYDDIMGLWKRAGLSARPKGRDSREELTRQMRENPQFFIGADIDGKLAGMIIASSDGRKGYLNRIAVDPRYRGQKIARQLTLEAEKALQEQGIKVITLLIETYNTSSIQLAKKMGYVQHTDIIYFSKRQSPED